MNIKQSSNNQFVVCINNQGYEASLEVGKIYRTIFDSTAKQNNLIRVTDETGEDYGFDVNRFYPIKLPSPIKEALLSVV